MKYETPVCEILNLDDSDIIATSTPIIDVQTNIDDLNQEIG